MFVIRTMRGPKPNSRGAIELLLFIQRQQALIPEVQYRP